MNERIFKYQESGFKEQNIKKLIVDGVIQEDNSCRIPHSVIMRNRQESSLKSYIDTIKIEPNKTSTNFDSFSILKENNNLYVNLSQNLGKEFTSDESQRTSFVLNLNDHLVPLDDIRKEIVMETTRTNYTHRKKLRTYTDLINSVKNIKKKVEISLQKSSQDLNDLMEEDKQTPSDKVKDKMDEIELNEKQQENSSHIQLNKKNIARKEKQREEIVLMIVYNKSPNGFGDSIQIFIESGYSLGLLRRFSYAGTKVIGLEEYRLLHTEKDKLMYPYDYPLTKAYQNIADDNGKKNLIELYCRKPPSKRLNYSKINSPYPFKSNWSVLNDDLVQIMISMPKRTPEELYYICLPEEQDLKLDCIEEATDPKMFNKLSLNAKNYNTDAEYIFKQKVYPETVKAQNKRKIKEMYKNELNKVKPDTQALNVQEQSMDLDPNLKIINSETLEVTTGLNLKRPIIGYITSGGFSMHRGYGVGIGSVLKKYIKSDIKCQYLLVRNPSSTYYYKAKIEKVY